MDKWRSSQQPGNKISNIITHIIHNRKSSDGGCKYCKTPVKNYADVDFAVKVKSKKDELLESLVYLKGKPNKTKQDNESIYTLEMVLKNMK